MSAAFRSDSAAFVKQALRRDVKSFAAGVLSFTVGPNEKINERVVS